MSDSIRNPMPPHVQWLVPNRGPALLVALDEREGLDMSAHDGVVHVMAADPSPLKHATQWLVDTYLAGGYLWEDLQGGSQSKVWDTLTLFAQHRRGLPPGLRNLESHASIAGLYAAMRPLLDMVGQGLGLDDDKEPGGRELRRQQRDQARMESIILHESAKLRLVVPTTRSAAQWWGRGTRWCTAADKSNMFDHYNRSAPLIIAVLPTTRFQLWIGDGRDIQFMDEADEKVTPEVAGLHWQGLQPLVEWACTRHGLLLELVPQEARTRELCMVALEHNPRCLDQVPPWVVNRDVCLAAVGRDGTVLGLVADRYKDPELCRVAFAQSAKAFAHFPALLKTPDICMAAVQAQPTLLFEVPPGMRTPEIYMAAVQGNGFCLNAVPMAERTFGLCRAAVVDNPYGLCVRNTDLPRAFRMPLYLEVNGREDKALSLLSPDDVTPEMALTAATSGVSGLSSIPRDLRTPELCHAAVSAHGHALCHIDYNQRTAELCWAAVQSDPSTLGLVPMEHRSSSLCLAALQGMADGKPTHEPIRNFGLLGHVPVSDGVMTPEMCRLASLQPGLFLHYVPMAWRTREICLRAVQANGMTLRWVPPELRDVEMCTLAMAHGESARANIPEDLAHVFPPGTDADARTCWQDNPDLEGLATHVAAWAELLHGTGLSNDLQATQATQAGLG